MPESPRNDVPEVLIRRTMPELDSVRGVAILLVVFFHGFAEFGTDGLSALPRLFVLGTTAGWIGVNLFFVLSGFLITGILLDSRGKPDYYKNFYIRRALRILPAYYLLLAVLWVLARIGLFDHREVAWEYIGLSFVYLANVTALFGVPMQYGPLWSLAVEEHFYLLWPAAVRWFSRRNLAWIAGGIFVGCPILRAIAYGMGSTVVRVQNPSYTWLAADGLAAGALLAIYCRWPGVDRKNVLMVSLACMGAALAMLAAGLPFGIMLSRSLLGGGSLRLTMLDLFFAGALGITIVIGTGRWRWLVQRPVLRFFGEISYGLYLIHVLVFDVFDHFARRYFPTMAWIAVRGHFGLMVLRFVCAAGVAVAIAFISRRTYEEKFLGMKERWTGAGMDAKRQKQVHAAEVAAG